MTDIKVMRNRYCGAKETKVGEKFMCPGCGTLITKRSYQHTFCGKTCKDRYWNNVDPRKKNRKHSKAHYRKYNVGAKSYEVRLGDADAQRRGYPSYADMIEDQCMEDGSWDAHGGVTVEPCEFCGMQYRYCRCD